MNIAKRDLLRAMSAKTGFTIANCEKAMNAFCEVLHAWMLEGHVDDKVNLQGVGSFTMEERPGKTDFLNHLTGNVVDIPPRRTIKFNLSPTIKAEYLAEAPTILK